MLNCFQILLSNSTCAATTRTSAELDEAVIHQGERATLLGGTTYSASTKLETKKKPTMTYNAI